MNTSYGYPPLHLANGASYYLSSKTIHQEGLGGLANEG